MGVIVQPSARKTFTPGELTAAYKDYVRSGPHYLDADTGVKASAYRFGRRVLVVYQEAETGVVLLVRPTSQDEMSSSSSETRNPGHVDRTAYAKYLHNDRWNRGVHEGYR